MQVGYCRISTNDQSLDLQADALQKAGCERIFSDVASGAKSDRAGLTEALTFARKGDVLVVWKLDRLGRSLPHLIETVKALGEREVGFRSLKEEINTATAGGKLFFHIMGALAEFERDMIRERTNAGLASARARGRRGGRPPVLDSKKAKIAASLYADGKSSIQEICDTLGVSRATLYRRLSLKKELTST
jgi:DNA invertase Pin-like site-specific DNA recombinase